MEEKSVNCFYHEKLALEYNVNNEKDLIFVAGYNKILNLPYIKNFLKSIDREFTNRYKSKDQDFSYFNEIFNSRLEFYESTYRETNTCKINNVSDKTQNFIIKNDDEADIDPIISDINLVEEKNTEFLAQTEYTEQISKPLKVSQNKNKQNKKKAKKEARSWGNKITASEENNLDYSDHNKSTKNPIQANIKKFTPNHFESKNVKPLQFVDDEIQKTSQSSVFKFFKGLIGVQIISKESLRPAIVKMKEHLISKNVALDISEKICNSVMEQLIGQSIRVTATLHAAIELALTNILTPKRNIQILNSIKSSESNRPYVIVFCGVNGVGKSTNLAKVAYYLLNNNQRVLIAACDTFRSGAVEQLKTHVYRFNSIFPAETPNCILFDKGYGKDSAGVALEAIKTATTGNYSVVLIDTAGRMQNNEPLMRSLGKLINVNQPDLVLFVGEALVGNDGVNQLMEFDRHLAEFSNSSTPHHIDGIILSKFDTIDDKVGAALSMTYVTGQP
ncbi:hypothetical protein MXB_3567, partial [Myxobolus squamalis]